MKTRTPQADVKKLVRWHNAYVVFMTKQAKSLGWNDRTMVKVTVSEGKVIVEKALQL